MTTPNPTPATQAIAAGGGWPPPPPPPPPPTPPILFSLVPSSGPTSGGNTVLIYGQGLFGVTSVTFGGVPATIVYQPPAPPPYPGPYPGPWPGPWPGPGPWDGGGDDDWDGGDHHHHLMQVAAGGGDWGGGGGGGYAGPLIVLAPPHAAGTVPVVVTTAYGTSNALNYTYVAPPAPPTVTSIVPTTGPTTGGTPFVINGTNLAGATSVTFGANAATILGSDATHVFGLTPAGMAAGPVTVTVTTPNGSATTTFTYFVAPPAPIVTSNTPGSGTVAGGTSVTMAGSNLGGVVAVLFNGVPGTITSNTGSSLVVTTPAGTVGSAPVTLVTASGTSAGIPFIYF